MVPMRIGIVFVVESVSSDVTVMMITLLEYARRTLSLITSATIERPVGVVERLPLPSRSRQW